MQLIDGSPVYSASDLVGFLACEHLDPLERAVLDGLVGAPACSPIPSSTSSQARHRARERYLADLDG